METFLIDRTQGVNIRVDVSKGKVKRIYNAESVLNDTMEAKYKGETISFLKTDFEAKMSPCYYNVRPEAILAPKALVNSIQMMQDDYASKISRLKKVNNPDEQILAKIERYESNISDNIPRLEEAKEKLNAEIERIEAEHDYKFETKIV